MIELESLRQVPLWEEHFARHNTASRSSAEDPVAPERTVDH